MALKSQGKPLTAEAWVQLVQDKVFKPYGLAEKPLYENLLADTKHGGFAKSGETVDGHAFPDFSGGLVMTAKQWARLVQSMQFGKPISDNPTYRPLPQKWYVHTRFCFCFCCCCCCCCRLCCCHCLCCCRCWC